MKTKIKNQRRETRRRESGKTMRNVIVTNERNGFGYSTVEPKCNVRKQGFGYSNPDLTYYSFQLT